MAERPSEVAMAAYRMALHVLEARRARQTAEERERRGKIALVVDGGGKRKGEAA